MVRAGSKTRPRCRHDSWGTSLNPVRRQKLSDASWLSIRPSDSALAWRFARNVKGAPNCRHLLDSVLAGDQLRSNSRGNRQRETEFRLATPTKIEGRMKVWSQIGWCLPAFAAFSGLILWLTPGSICF